ncbi:MAG: AraC family transcriptional regulator [Bacteroidales bacterium]|jgi:AraC-like DNA-binding protein|nr:AraC family transcriptional regulator [Bacteroidales bacterium]
MKKEFTLKDFIAKNEESLHYENKFAILDLSNASKSKRQYHQLDQPLVNLCTLIVINGEVNITVDTIPYCLKENMMLIFEGRQRIINSFYASEDCEGHCLVFEDDYLEMLVHEEKPPREFMTNIWLAPVIKFDKDDFAVLQNVVERIYFNLRRPDHAFLSGMLKNELRSFHYEIWNALFRNNTIKSNAITPYEKTATRFIQLLQNNFRKEHEVAYYASELCVSSVFLTRAMKKVTRKTAGRWIDEVLVAESKILLRKPGSSIKEIADELKFSDQASFSKFFKKNTGEAPIEYKKKMR